MADTDHNHEPQSKRWLVLGSLAAIGVALGGYAYFTARARDAERAAVRADAASAWANMQQCLLGAPLAEVSSTAAWVRGIELAGNDPNDPAGWPRACAPHVTALYQALDDREFGSSLKEQLRERFGCETACLPDAPATQLAGLMEAVEQAGLDVVAPTVAAPTRVVEPFILKEALSELAPGDSRIQARDYLTDGRARYLFNSRGQGLSFCEIAPDADPPTRCVRLSLPITPSTAGFVSASHEPLIRGRAREDDDETFFDLKGRNVVSHAGEVDGFALTTVDARSYRVERVQAGAVVAESRQRLPQDASLPMLVDTTLLYTAPGDSERMLFARTLGATGKDVISEEVQIGPAAAIHGAPEVCRRGATSALLFGQNTATWSLVLRQGEAFSGPLAAMSNEPAEPPPAAPKPAPDEAKPNAEESDPARQAALRRAKNFGMAGLLDETSPSNEPSLWGEGDPPRAAEPVAKAERSMWADQLVDATPRQRAALPRHALSCSGDHATITWRTPRGDDQIIHRVRCTSAGCEHAQVVLGGIDVKSWWSALTLEASGVERVLLVWRDGRGVLNKRYAQLHELAAAPTTVVMDSAEHGGPTTLDLEVVYAGEAAVFVFRGKGFHALRFGGDGRVTPL